jgi:uncharacterized membrane protein
MSPQTPSKSAEQKSVQMGVGFVAEYSGPLPSAQELERYEKLLPGAAKLLFEKFAEEQTHRHELEKNESAAGIRSMDRHYDGEDKERRFSFFGHVLGQVLSVFVCLAALALCGYLAMNGHTWEAVAVVAIPFAGIIRAIKSGK